MENFQRVLGVLAGGDVDPDVLRLWAHSADRIIAADAGADLLEDIGITPHLVIGDMDSISPLRLESVQNRLHISDQDTTDCDKLLAQAANEGHRALTLIGIEGDLPDHVLAILHSAARSTLQVELAYRKGMGYIIKSEQSRQVSTNPGRRISLLAIEPSHGVSLTGVKWPLENARLSLLEGTSISNRAEDPKVSVTVGQGAALLFVEVSRDELPVWPLGS